MDLAIRYHMDLNAKAELDVLNALVDRVRDEIYFKGIEEFIEAQVTLGPYIQETGFKHAATILVGGINGRTLIELRAKDPNVRIVGIGLNHRMGMGSVYGTLRQLTELVDQASAGWKASPRLILQSEKPKVKKDPPAPKPAPKVKKKPGEETMWDRLLDHDD